MNRITELFKKRKKGDKVMNLFITAGYPDPSSTVELILGFEKNGADLIELGMPFSDPLADGPTIQYSSEVAISKGTTIAGIMDIVTEVRKRSQIPIVLMGYMNPVLRYGVEKFCKDAHEAGVDGLILPDIPLDESGIIKQYATRYELPLIFLVAPNTTDERMKLADQESDGFVYCVSVTGVTGAREGGEVSRSVQGFIDRVRSNIKKNPILIGFGIRSHSDAVLISQDVDGFIVGSALIEAIRSSYPEQEWKEKVFSFVHSLKFGH